MKHLIKTFIFVFSVVCLYNCTKKRTISKNDLEIILKNDSLYTFSDKSLKDTVNIIRYSIKNNSSNIYYINKMIRGSEVYKDGIYKNGVTIFVFDSNTKKEIKYREDLIYYDNFDTKSFYDFMKNEADSTSKWLGYKHTLDYFETFDLEDKRIFIHPNEELYFEYPIFMKKFQKFDGNRTGFINLNSSKNYYATLSIASDRLISSNKLPRDVLKTIEINNAKIYHGIIESKNKVPIKVLE